MTNQTNEAIERYKLEIVNNHGDRYIRCEPAPDGSWIMFKDVAMLQARIAELQAALRDARHDLVAFIENAHPHREKYPHIMKDFENDMEIVRRIDAALEGGKS